MSDWHLASVWEAIAERIPEAPAVVQGTRRVSWGAFDRRADGIAHFLLQAGVDRQATVAQYLFNCPEYLESLFGAFKASLVPVNTNYRYVDDELVYLWDNADVVAVVFHGTFSDRIAGLRHLVPSVRTWLWVDDHTGDCPGWAVPYEEAAACATTRTRPPWGRSGDDLYLLYTGGTTGLPKGVMWRVDDLFSTFNATTPGQRYPQDGGVDDVRSLVTASGPAGLPVAPLMHGAGSFTAFSLLGGAGTVVLLSGRSFDPVELLDTVEREQVSVISLIGDVFARPVLRALEAQPDRWNLSSLTAIVSSGVMWTEDNKRGLLRHLPGVELIDAFAASETPGMGVSVSSGASPPATARFDLGPDARVLDDDGAEVAPGSGIAGRVAVTGRIPLGYYKDPEKTAATFPVIDGRRYSLGGDYALVEADGTLRLLGRGSMCINTGGEKVFPEEVEEALKRHPTVADAAVFGVPDERWGEAVVAVVEPNPSCAVDEGTLIAHVRTKLAAYKAPRRVLAIAALGRAANGKVDYTSLRDHAVVLLAEKRPAGAG